MIPFNVHLIEKTEPYTDKQTGATKYKSPLSKNEMTRQLLVQTAAQRVLWRYFLADSWFSCAETMNVVHDTLVQHYIMAVECSQEMASDQDKQRRVDALHHTAYSISNFQLMGYFQTLTSASSRQLFFAFHFCERLLVVRLFACAGCLRTNRHCYPRFCCCPIFLIFRQSLC